MKLHIQKPVLIAGLFLLGPAALASTISEQLDRLLAPSHTAMEKADIETRYNFVASDADGETRLNVYIKLRDASFPVRSKGGARGGLTMAEQGLERLPSDLREGVLKVYKNRGMVSASLTLDQIRALKQQDYVAWVEPWLRFTPQSDESHSLTGVIDIHAEGNYGAGQTIAIIDTEFAASMSLANPRVIGGRDIADNDNDFTISPTCDVKSHGTQVTSIAATSMGVAKEANLALLKLSKDSGCGSLAPSEIEDDVVEALEWVADNRERLNISVVNMSLAANLSDNSVAGCTSYAQAYSDSLQALYDAGVAVIAAAGNVKDKLSFPACMPTTISVGAVFDSNDIEPFEWGNLRQCVQDACPVEYVFDDEAMTGFYYFGEGHPRVGELYDQSVGGPKCPGVDRVTCYSSSTNAELLDVLAPSDCARATTANGGPNHCFDGTSAAAPFVAGMVALINARAGGTCLSVEDIRQILTSSPKLVTDSFSQITTPRVDASVITDFVEVNQCNNEPPADPEDESLDVATLMAIIQLLSR